MKVLKGVLAVTAALAALALLAPAEIAVAQSSNCGINSGPVCNISGITCTQARKG